MLTYEKIREALIIHHPKATWKPPEAFDTNILISYYMAEHVIYNLARSVAIEVPLLNKLQMQK